jgi:hypothetical protein
MANGYAKYSGLGGGGTGGGSGTVTSVSVVNANGFNGTVANPTTTPAITLSTTVTGLLQGNGTAISAYTGGNLTDVGTDGITITNGTGAVIGTGTQIAQAAASASQNGYLSSANFTIFNNKQAAGNYITNLVGDGTASGPGSATFTLATVNSNVGSFGSSTAIPSFTVNAKGLITAASTNVVIAPAGTLSGTTLNSTVVSSSLTSVGTVTTGVWNGSVIGTTYGGTGLSSPGASGNVLTSNGTNWVSSPSTGGVSSLNSLSGALTIAAGTGITVTPSGSTITIASTGGGSGTVTSVALTAPSIFNVGGSPVTTSGTLALTYSGTALPIANGGTGQTTAQSARSSSGLNIDERTAVSDANYTVLLTDRYVGLTAITAARTFSLPAASTLNAGQELIIQDESGNLSGVLTLTLTPNGTDKINNASSVVLLTPYAQVILKCNGSNGWFYSGSANTATALTPWSTALAVTPSAGFGTVTGLVTYTRIEQDSLRIRAYWQNGTTAASAAYFTLPSGYTADTTKIGDTNMMVGSYQQLAGQATWNPSAQSVGWLVIQAASTTQVAFTQGSTTTQYSPVTSVSGQMNIDGVSLDCLVPIVGLSSTSTVLGAPAVVSISANTTVGPLLVDTTYLVNTASSAITVTLPAPVVGIRLTIKDAAGNASTNNITVARHASENIEGIAANKVLRTNWGASSFISDGTNWFMV